MARIRSIKPEFWRSPSTAKASPRARLLYIAMWNWADDYGVGEWTVRELLGFAFPNDLDVTDAEFQSLCTEVATCFNTMFYIINGRRFYYIPTWDDHQKNERRATGKYPKPDSADSTPDQAFSSTAEIRGDSAPSHGSSDAGTGNRGTGEQSLVQPKAERDSEFNEWWLVYPRKEGKVAARKVYDRHRRTFPAETLLAGVQAYALSCIGKEREFIKLPAGWLNDGRWDAEYTQPKPTVSGIVTAQVCPHEYPIGACPYCSEGQAF